MAKKILKTALIIIGIIVLLVAILFAWLSITEFKPDEIMDTEITVNEDLEETNLAVGDSISVISWNIGYAGLGKESDFFMDGGEEVAAADNDTVNSYLNSIYDFLYIKNDADVYMLQEVDEDSTRTYHINEKEYLGIFNSSYAYNYKCPFVPYPLPPIGTVNSGLLTTTRYTVDAAERVALPCPFKWPVSIANLKRCMMVSYLPIKDSDKQLVVINFHLEAYDDGEGKIAQTKILLDFIEQEYKKGNYVIAGGDWNQTFPGSRGVYPNKFNDLWNPGSIENIVLPEGWQLCYDLTVPSCRLLNQPYDENDVENTQYYVIDGYAISPNLQLESVYTMDIGFKFSDHNPVKLQVTLLDK